MSDFLTIDELAESMKVSGKTIQRWADDGKIPYAVHEGKVVRFNLADVKRSLRKRAAKNAEKSAKHQPDDGMVPVL